MDSEGKGGGGYGVGYLDNSYRYNDNTLPNRVICGDVAATG